MACELDEPLLARAYPDDRVPLALKVRADEAADRQLVLDEQERPARGAPRLALRACQRRRDHRVVAITRFAAALSTRIVVACIRFRRAAKEPGPPLTVTWADGETAIVTSVPSRSKSVSDEPEIARIRPRSIRKSWTAPASFTTTSDRTIFGPKK